jgi:hypothetical protein
LKRLLPNWSKLSARWKAARWRWTNRLRYLSAGSSWLFTASSQLPSRAFFRGIIRL